MGTFGSSVKSFSRVATLGLLFGASALASTSSVSIHDVNQKVVALVAPFNNEKTQIDFSFTKLAVDEVRATEVGFKGVFNKKGTNNEVTFEIPKAEYSYGDGTNPTAKLSVALKFDVVKALGQKLINEFSKSLEEVVVESGTEYTQEYGEAAEISATVVDKKVDANGDVESVKMELSASVDLTKLPETRPLSETEFKTLQISVSGARDGFNLDVTVVLNPAYKRFLVGDDGLKEYVEKLLADDQSAYVELSQLIAVFDSVVTMLAEMDASKSPFAF